MTIETTWEQVETTAFGSTVRQRTYGLGDHSISVEFQNDYAAANVNPTVQAILPGTTTMLVWAAGSTTGTANPKHTLGVLVDNWTPLGGAVGDLITASVTWPVNSYATALS